MPQIKFTDRDQATNFLAECAKLAYGSGMLEGKSGGNGNIGMLGERVVKFRTHLSERSGEVTKNMADSCAELRKNLLNSVKFLLKKEGDQVDEAGNAFIEALKRDLDIGEFQDDDSNSQKAKSLLDRKVVAKVIDKIEKFTNDRIFDKALNGQTPASSKGVDTTFKAVITRKANEILADYGKQMSALAYTLRCSDWSSLKPEQQLGRCLDAAKLFKNIADFVLNKSYADRFATYLAEEHEKSQSNLTSTGRVDMLYMSEGLKQSIEEWEQYNSCDDDETNGKADMQYMSESQKQRIVPWDRSKWGYLKEQNLFDSMRDLTDFVMNALAGDTVEEFETGYKSLRSELSSLIVSSSDSSDQKQMLGDSVSYSEGYFDEEYD